MLAPDRFDAAFCADIAAWAYKHPSPSDFFRLIDNRPGEDLSWWWRGWSYAQRQAGCSQFKRCWRAHSRDFGMFLCFAHILRKL
jgi:hypothetical protein